MSLEIAIQENTAAVRDLIALLTAKPLPTMSATEYVKTLDSARPEDKALPKSEEMDAAVAKVEEAAKAEVKKEEAKAETTAAPLDYNKDVKPMLLKLSVGKGRDALVGLLGKFGVAKGDALPADKLHLVVAEVETLLAA